MFLSTWRPLRFKTFELPNHFERRRVSIQSNSANMDDTHYTNLQWKRLFYLWILYWHNDKANSVTDFAQLQQTKSNLRSNTCIHSVSLMAQIEKNRTHTCRNHWKRTEGVGVHMSSFMNFTIIFSEWSISLREETLACTFAHTPTKMNKIIH